MYYLVRDYYDETEKKIFSDKDDIEECMDEYKDKPMLLVYSWEQGMYNDTRNGKRIYFDQYYILKKSENVFDFIEVGDLIKIFWKNHNYTYIRQVTSTTFQEKYGQIDVEGSLGIDDDEILEIYKPDKHGNYIKVWEKEN